MAQQNILVTDTAGFIGSKVCEFFLTESELIPNDLPMVSSTNERMTNGSMTVYVIGIDNINDYYDVRLKERRLPANMMATWADTTKAINILTWQPEIKLEQSVETAVQ